MTQRGDARDQSEPRPQPSVPTPRQTATTAVRRRPMPPHKAARPTNPKKVRRPRTVLSTGKPRDQKASSTDFAMQAVSVYAGATCIGFLLPGGKSGVEAFDADEHSLG